jgi:sugar lactone lactonase YvrE
MLKEMLRAEGDTADIRLDDLAVDECRGIYFTGSGVAVLLCSIGGGLYRVSAKSVPKNVARTYGL